MAMTNCPECKKGISNRAKSCPHCGAEQPKKTSRLSMVLAGLVLALVIAGIATQEPDKPTAAKTPAEIQSEKEFQQVVAAVKSLKASAESIIKCNTQPVRYGDGQTLRTTHS